MFFDPVMMAFFLVAVVAVAFLGIGFVVAVRRGVANEQRRSGTL